MAEILEGETIEVQGSLPQPYKVKRTGDVIFCECKAWKNQSLPVNKRSCKHIRSIRGDQAETERVGGSLSMRAPKTKFKVQAVPPALLLANKWDASIDPTGWYASEKLDGVRALWTGKEFMSRLGNRFDAPAWFTKGLGKERLDGELWMGRKLFQKTISVVKSQGLDKEWKGIKYLVFDMPDMKQPFETRYVAMQALELPDHCKVVEQTKCKGIEHLKETLKAYEAKGGEGVMLRQAGSLYEGRRSSTLLKVKTFHDDEATITDYEPGKGRHKGRLGAYICKLKNGKVFSCGSGLLDKDRDHPLKIGTKITFRFQELSNDGIPRFPTYVGEALDK